MNRAEAQRKTRDKIAQYGIGDVIAKAPFDLRANTLTYEDVRELPEGVRAKPIEAQYAFMASFNANVRRFKDVGYAMNAATRAMENACARIEEERRRRPAPSATDRIIEQLESAMPRKAQVVVCA